MHTTIAVSTDRDYASVPCTISAMMYCMPMCLQDCNTGLCMVQKDEDKLLKRLLNASDRERNSAKKKQAAELKKAEKRKAEVDGLFAKMYEDWSAGRITEYNFNMLSEKYQNEQKELETKIRQLHETMEAAVQTAADAEKWIALMKQYVNPVELTAELLNTLIEKITVHEAVKGEDGSREQEVEIYYRFIGKID